MAENLTFYTPEQIFTDLKAKFNSKSVSSLMKELRRSSNKEDRELFYGAVFSTGLKYVTKHDYYLKTASNEPADIEVLDRTLNEQNQDILKSKRQTDHWRAQNVSITEHVMKEKINKGVNNFYRIIKEHLTRTKLDKKAGDYKGCILVFHLKLNLKGKADIRVLRKTIREVEQDNFEQIWITGFRSKNFNECFITELLYYDLPLLYYPISII